MASRRSVPPAGLKGPGPSREQMVELLRLASRVPDHGKLAPWRFVVIAGQGQQQIGEIIAAAVRADQPQANAALVEMERNRMALAPVVVAVVSTARSHPKIPLWEQELSAGAVCMALTQAVCAMGFSSAWLTGWLAFDRRILGALGLEPDERIAGYIHIGKAEKTPPDRERPDLAEIVAWYGES